MAASRDEHDMNSARIKKAGAIFVLRAALLVLTCALPAQPPARSLLFARVVDEKGQPVVGADVTTLRRDESLPLWIHQYRRGLDQRERTVRQDACYRRLLEVPGEMAGMLPESQLRPLNA